MLKTSVLRLRYSVGIYGGFRPTFDDLRCSVVLFDWRLISTNLMGREYSTQDRSILFEQMRWCDQSHFFLRLSLSLSDSSLALLKFRIQPIHEPIIVYKDLIRRLKVVR